MPIRSAPNPNSFITPPLPDLFLVRITVVNSGTPDTYEFEEWHTTSTTSGLPGSTGPWEVKAGGRIGTSDNPGYAIPAADGTETTFAVDDFAWCRSAAGNAGLTWELVPISGGGSAPVTTWKEPARVMATSNVNISTALENGDTLNGVTLATGDRVFLPFQTNAWERLVYIVQASGAAQIAPDMTDDTMSGAVITVCEGTAYADTMWECTTNRSAVDVGVNGLDWRKMTPLTTKGDILTHDGTNEVRLGVGANTYVLIADDGETAGVKWDTPNNIVVSGGSGCWVRVATCSYTVFSAASASAYVNIGTFPAKTIILGGLIVVTTKFDEPTHGNIWLYLGRPGYAAEYCSSAFLASITPSATSFRLYFPGTPMTEEYSASTGTMSLTESCTIQAAMGTGFTPGTGPNTNTLTQGEAEFWLYISTVP